VADTRARITRSIASTGYFVISTHYIGYWTKTCSFTDTKYRFPIGKVAGARRNKRYIPHIFGLILDLRERPSIYFDFLSAERRDEVLNRVRDSIASYSARKASTMKSSSSVSSTTIDSSSQNKVMNGLLTESPSMTPTKEESPLPEDGLNQGISGAVASHILSPLSYTFDRVRRHAFPKEALPFLPKVINLPASMVPHQPPKHFVCLTIGSRGDVQPYIALAQELMRVGNVVTIVTHAEYKDWIEGWGVRHRTAGGDPGALMKLSVEHKVSFSYIDYGIVNVNSTFQMFSPQFFKESLGSFRSWLDDRK
jgi:sterol 3beta-glucosyltransferase